MAPRNKDYLNQVFRQNELIIENSEFIHNQKKNDGKQKINEVQIQLLLEQMQVRDQIIQEQKKKMEFNHLQSSSLNYSVLKSFE